MYLLGLKGLGGPILPLLRNICDEIQFFLAFFMLLRNNPRPLSRPQWLVAFLYCAVSCKRKLKPDESVSNEKSLWDPFLQLIQ